MKIKELRSLNKDELNKKLSELKLELIKINAQVATGTPPKNIGQIKELKKNVARIKTILNQKTKVNKKA